MKCFVRTLGLLLSAILGLSFVGCAGETIDPHVTKICIIDKGYGTNFVYKLVEEYNKTATVKATVSKTNSDDTYTSTSMFSSASANDVDLYFAIEKSGGLNLIQGGKVRGFDNILEDLSDLYNQPLQGYSESKTLKEWLDPYFYDAITYNDPGSTYHGKQYSVPWATAYEGIVYNTKLFEDNHLSVPRTTKELMELLETIKKLSLKTANGKDIYGFTFSGAPGINYGMYMTTVWFAQYIGSEAFDNFTQAKDMNGNMPGASIYKQRGRYSAYKYYHDIIKRENGYVFSNDTTRTFTQVQQGFLAGQSFMMNTGDWLEREMESNTNAIKTIEFMPIPVNSDIIETQSAMPEHSIKTEEALRYVIDYINGDETALNKITATNNDGTATIADADIEYVRVAQKMYMVEGDQHVMVIPSYANQKEGAKDFIQFVLSKAGQEIMISEGSGNSVPLTVGMQTFDAWDNLSQLQKSKLKIGTNAHFVGRKANTPIAFNGGFSIVPMINNVYCDNVFGLGSTSASYMNAQKYWEEEYNYMNKMWDDIVQNA